MYCCCFYISVISYVERVRNEKLKYTAYRGIFTVVPVPRNALSTDQQTTVIVFQKITKYKYKIVFFFQALFHRFYEVQSHVFSFLLPPNKDNVYTVFLK